MIKKKRKETDHKHLPKLTWTKLIKYYDKRKNNVYKHTIVTTRYKVNPIKNKTSLPIKVSQLPRKSGSFTGNTSNFQVHNQLFFAQAFVALKVFGCNKYPNSKENYLVIHL